MCSRLICGFILVSALGLTASSFGSDMADGLVGYWPLDEGGGDATVDASGIGNDGTLNGGPTWVAGKFGNALEFDGTDDHVDLGNPPILDLGTSDFAISAWVNTSSAGGETIVAKGGDNGGGIRWRLFIEGNPGVKILVDDDATKYDPEGDIAVVDGQWHHLIGMRIGTDLRVYVDGVEDEGATAHGESTIPADYDLSGTSQHNAYIGCLTAHDTGSLFKFFSGTIDDVAIWNRALTQEEIDYLWNAGAGNPVDVLDPGQASDPSPEDEQVDVSRDVMLSWSPGEFAATHDVYLGTAFDDVNTASADVLVSSGQAANSHDPGRLEFSQTYYWRVDEVNAAPDNTTFAGETWSFTVEPLAYPIADVTATSNGEPQAGTDPQNTANGAGLNENDEHSTDAVDMWLGAPVGDESLYIQYEFDRVYKLHEMQVWNYNVVFEAVLGFGLKDVTVEYSENGTDWTALGDVELAQATAKSDYTANTIVDFGGAGAKVVRLTINSNHGALPQFGLSEVRFMFIPAHAREPQPADGETGVDLDPVLDWRMGRDATSHEVHLSTDEAAVAAGDALVDTVAEKGYAPEALDFGTTYYWRIDEVQETESWAGDIWSFVVQEYAVIDDMESYNDDDNRIFDTWLDGFVNETGATVGYFDAPFAEQGNVNSGRQSMPLGYANDAAPFYSEAELDLGSMDLETNGADSLRLFITGAVDNTPDQVYVAVEDATGSVAIVAHPDADIVAVADWTEWVIPFGDLAGVDLGRVAIMYIGVGDRENPAAGGTGTILIDDIGYGSPTTE